MEKHDLENFPTSESAKKMLSYVSDGFYDESYVGKWLYQVMGLEYDKVLEIVNELPEQFFPETATWGLVYHEVKWGLPIRSNLPYEERRKLIYRKRDCRAPITPYQMELSLKNVTGFEVRIADANDLGEYGYVPSHPNVFMAYFTGDGTLDSKLVRSMLDALKQSHVTYKINDRVEITVDNGNLEKMVLRVVNLQIGIFFLGSKTYPKVESIKLHIAMEKHLEEFGAGSITVRRNLWYLDGSVRLDGSRNLNALCRLEEL